MAYINGNKICLFGVIFTAGDTLNSENDVFINNGILYVVAPSVSVNIVDDVLCVTGSSVTAKIENDILHIAVASTGN